MRVIQIMRGNLRRLGQQSKVVLGVTAGLVVGGVGSAAVMASIPDNTGVIHACYRNTSFRVIDSATQTCNANETLLTWNQTGPQGPAGPVGPQGPAGSAGPGSFVSNLVGANFSNASLPYRNFANLDLHNALFGNMTGNPRTTLTGSDFQGANLSGASFVSTLMNEVNAAGANFSGASLRGFSTPPTTRLSAVNTNFQGANFSGAQLLGAIEGGNYQGAIFTGATFGGFISTASQLINADLQGVDFTSVTFQPLGSQNPIFLGSNLSGANFSGMTLSLTFANGTTVANTNFGNVAFVNSTLSGTDFSAADLAGSSWSNTICPDGTNSDANGSTCIGHLVP